MAEMKFKELTEKEVQQIDKLQSEYFTKYMHLFDPPLPDGVPERLEKIVLSAGISGSDRVLDIGTGTGILIPIILKYEPALVYANDLSKKMLESVKARYPDVRTLHGDIRDLKLPQSSIDVVFVNACYPNIADKHRSFVNIRRMTRSGCHIVISHPMGSSFIGLLQEKVPFSLDDFPEDETVAMSLFSPYGFKVSDLVKEDNLYILVLEG